MVGGVSHPKPAGGSPPSLQVELRWASFAALRGRRVAGATGLEPATYGVTGRHSNQLSYAPAGARGPKIQAGREGSPM